MKKTILFLGLLSMGLTFGQQNQSSLPVATAINTPIGQQFSGQEIFRFRSGIVTQLDAGSAFDFTGSQWFGIGRVGGTPNGFNQNFYGLRFQQPNKALIMGYTSAVPNNPRIEWVGTGASLGDLEFRVGSGFGTPGVPGPNTLVATMTSFGNTVFGTSNPFGNTASGPKVGIVTSANNTGLEIANGGFGTGLLINSNNSGVGFEVNSTNNSAFNNNIGGTIVVANSSINEGLIMKTFGGNQATGIYSVAFESDNCIAVRGLARGFGNFDVGIYGEAIPVNGNEFAGFFDGEVFATGNFTPSDERLKNNIVTETKALDKIAQLRPVTYQYKDLKTINLSKGLQHGFISQEVAKVFPELTKDIVKPVFDKEGKKIDEVSFKSINYDGLISVLTASVQELHQEVKNLKEELSSYKTDENLKKASIQENNFNANEFYLDQNIPNPFTDQTTISYRLPKNINNASIMIFDLNGKLIQEYPITKNNGAIIIKTSEVGKGMFLYSIAYLNQEMITKKMIVR